MALKETISGIRGIWGSDLTPKKIENYIKSLISILPKTGKIVIGRDSRKSGKEIIKIIADTLSRFGFESIDTGIQPTPTIEIVTADLSDAICGIVVTASHNPPEYNGLKFLNNKGMFFDAESMNKLLTANFDNIKESTKHGKKQIITNAVQTHIDRIFDLDTVDFDSIHNRKFKVLFDANGGAGASLLPTLLKRLGCEVTTIGGLLDGKFLHPPTPSPESLKDICSEVLVNKSDIGMSTDPDADRLALIDETGKAISEELTLAIAVDYYLRKTKTDIVINLSTSSLIESIANKHGVTVTRVPVGEINVSTNMLSTDAIIGGEGNGGVILTPVHPGRDSGIGATLVLAALAETGKTLSEYVSGFPTREIVKTQYELPETLEIDEKSLQNSLNPLKIDKQDGFWVGFEDGFLHIRKSNTEPIARIIAESSSEEKAQELIKKALEFTNLG